MPPGLLALTNMDGSWMFGWLTALFCRSDTSRAAPAEWKDVDFGNISYELVPGDGQDPYAVFVRCKVHGMYSQVNGEVVQTPFFHSIRRLADGSCELNFRVFAGRTNVLEASTNLAQWTSLADYAPATGDRTLRDSSATSQRFYRLRLP